MDEMHLHSMRRDPPPAFAEQLRLRLREQGGRTAPAATWRVRRVAAPLAAAAAVAVLFTLPQVRASAQSFLAMFRTVNFVAVPVDPGRMEVLRSQDIDIPKLLGERLEVIEDSGPATLFVSPEQAGAAAGIAVRQPAFVPPNSGLATISVRGQNRGRVSADVERLREVMNLLGIRDLDVPDGLQGQVIDVRIPPIVTLTYERGGESVVKLLQMATPEVSLPSGIDLAALGEIGLRILGLSLADARQFARAIDWTSTLLVPIPPGATEFRQVDVNGATGVLFGREPDRARGRPGAGVVVWSKDDRVYALDGSIHTAELLQMALSVR
jgi:hypothetical protein